MAIKEQKQMIQDLHRKVCIMQTQLFEDDNMHRRGDVTSSISGFNESKDRQQDFQRNYMES